MSGRIEDGRWCFVSGMPRSGTTFVASVLSASPRVVYVHEPFNARCGIGGVDWSAAREVGADLRPTLPAAVEAARGVRGLGYRLETLVPETDGWARRWGKRVIGSRGPWHLRLGKVASGLGLARSGVVKDPTAWFYSAFVRRDVGMPVVFTVKHPLSQVASYRRAGWRPDLDRVRRQEHLMGRLTAEDRRLLEGCGRGKPDILEEVAVEWRVIMRLIRGFAAEDGGTGWYVVRLEDVSADPARGFAVLAEELGLPFDGWSRRKVRRLTGGGSATARAGRFQDLRRDSSGVFAAKYQSFTAAERDRVRALTGEVGETLYGVASFEEGRIEFGGAWVGAPDGTDEGNG